MNEIRTLYQWYVTVFKRQNNLTDIERVLSKIQKYTSCFFSSKENP
jgi:hypothetical protein